MARQAISSQAGGQLLLARAAMLASVAVGLAGTAHMLAGGDTPAPLVFAVAVVTLIPLVVLLGRGERGWFPITALLLFSQLVLHPLFAAFPAHSHTAAVHDQLRAGGAGAGRMEWAHLAAALATAWWLRRGQARACQLARGTHAAASRPLTAALALADTASVPRPALTVIRPASDRHVLRSHAPGTLVRRRGPPVTPVALPG